MLRSVTFSIGWPAIPAIGEPNAPTPVAVTSEIVMLRMRPTGGFVAPGL